MSTLPPLPAPGDPAPKATPELRLYLYLQVIIAICYVAMPTIFPWTALLPAAIASIFRGPSAEDFAWLRRRLDRAVAEYNVARALKGIDGRRPFFADATVSFWVYVTHGLLVGIATLEALLIGALGAAFVGLFS
jgi:hypothetical protein